MRKRAALVIIKDGHLALIKRVYQNKTYYVFPGGGIEAHETRKEAARREALEELGVQVAIGPCIMELTGNRQEYYFIAAITEGQFGSGTREEFTGLTTDRGSYEAVWLPSGILQAVILYPEEISVVELIEIGSVDYWEKGIVKKKTIIV